MRNGASHGIHGTGGNLAGSLASVDSVAGLAVPARISGAF